MRLLKLGGSLAAAKLADDAVDGAIGATKARYVGAAVSGALLAFQKGGSQAPQGRHNRGCTSSSAHARTAALNGQQRLGPTVVEFIPPRYFWAL